MKTLKQIPFSDIPSIPQLIKDFIGGKLAFAEEHSLNEENILQKIQQRKSTFTSEKRNLLVAALKDQMKLLKISSKQEQHIGYLEKENTFTITTGHQLNLFTGPVFFIYKILQTIKTAEFLSIQNPDSQFVPVFWMATEDHDFEEINHFKTEKNYYDVTGNAGGAVGHIKVEHINNFNQFQEEFGSSPYGPELFELYKSAYENTSNLAEATKILVQELFSDFGLIIIDGDHKSLKAQMIDTFRSEMISATLKQETDLKVTYLEEKYGKVQVNPRDINLFYLSETRNRIEATEYGYHIVDSDLKFTREEMIAELENYPEKFSPNALMRPVYQETVLPNLAYIGGNAEMMYWLELPDYFKSIGLPFPILIPRNSFLFIREKTVQKLSKLKIPLEDLLKKEEILINSKLTENHQIENEAAQLEIILQSQFNNLIKISSETDVTFKNLVEAEQTRQLKSFDRMKKRLLRAEKIKQAELVERIENILAVIHPDDIWQERVYNFSTYYAENGTNWMLFCLENMPVNNPNLVIAQI